LHNFTRCIGAFEMVRECSCTFLIFGPHDAGHCNSHLTFAKVTTITTKQEIADKPHHALCENSGVAAGLQNAHPSPYVLLCWIWSFYSNTSKVIGISRAKPPTNCGALWCSPFGRRRGRPR